MSTVNLDCKLDLKSIALQARNAEYNPKVCIFEWKKILYIRLGNVKRKGILVQSFETFYLFFFWGEGGGRMFWALYLGVAPLW